MSGLGVRPVPGSRAFAVYRGDEQVSGQRYGKASVEQLLDDMARRAKCKTRPCITCGQPFLSEGAHNRMCKGCRTWASDVYQGAV